MQDQDLCWSWWWYLCQFRMLELGCFAGSMVSPTILLLFLYFFWRSGLLECWSRLYVRGHWFGCSLRPGTLLYSRWIHLPFRGHWPYRLSCSRTNDWQFSTYPRRRIPAITSIPHGSKATLCGSALVKFGSALLTSLTQPNSTTDNQHQHLQPGTRWTSLN